MDNFNQDVLMLMVGAATLIWTMMEGAIKPILKQGSEQVVTRFNLQFKPEWYPTMFQGAAWLLGIGAVLLYRDLSFLKLWGVLPNATGMEILDVIATGYAISRGERGLHQVVDLLAEFGTKLQTELPDSVPASESVKMEGIR